MNAILSKKTGWLALLAGLSGVLALTSLLLFFLGLVQNINSLDFMGGVNDTLNGITSILSALLASALYPVLRGTSPRLSLFVLIGAWAGALSVIFGSWLIQSGRADVELSSYYFFFGNGLIGFWLWMLNRAAHQQALVARGLTTLGLVASLFMMWGLLGLYGILLGLDGNDYSPLIMIAGISFLGTGMLYPLWCLRLGGDLLKRDR